jgi:hypothetical protein
MTDVFISCAREDLALAESPKARLELSLGVVGVNKWREQVA